MTVYTSAEIEALSFLRSAYGYADLDHLQAHFARTVYNWGVTRFSVTQVVAEASEPPAPRLLFGHRFDMWDARYVEADYFRHDPCVPRFFRGRGAFTWEDVKPLRYDALSAKMFEEVGDIGIKDGMVIPVYGGDGEVLCARLMAEESIEDLAARGILEGLATVYATAGLRLLEVATDTQTEHALTLREITCLFWVSQAKSDDAIGIILGISANTVHTHIERAKKKLGGSTRGLAAAKARAQGMFAHVSKASVTR